MFIQMLWFSLVLMQKIPPIYFYTFKYLEYYKVIQPILSVLITVSYAEFDL